jgi:hypothetical protein
MTPALLQLLPPLLAWQERGFDVGQPGNDAAGAMVTVIIALLAIAVGLGIKVFIIYLNYKALDRLPPQFRQMEPWQPWLLFIPCFEIVWNFFVFTKVPASLRSYFNAKGRTDVGDCGESLGLWFAITAIFCGPVALVLLIMYLLRISELTKQLS